jgi:hypothetical protein
MMIGVVPMTVSTVTVRAILMVIVAIVRVMLVAGAPCHYVG